MDRLTWIKNTIILFLCIVSYVVEGQENSLLLRLHHDSKCKKVCRLLNLQKEKFSDSTVIFLRLENKISLLQQKGFLESNVDSIVIKGNVVNAYVHVGNQYRWGKVRFKSINSVPIKNSVLDARKAVDWKVLEKNTHSILSELTNQAYPFASLRLEDISVKNNKVDAVWIVDSKQKITWDTIVIKGKAKINKKFVQRYIGVKPNRKYQEKVIKNLSDRILKLAFLQQIKPAEIEFTSEKAKTYLYLKNKPANQFDGILGFQQNEKDQFELTGDVNLLLNNVFSAGEKIKLNWKQFASKSQKLKLEFNYPYLFNSSLGLDFNFDLEKQDTTYITTDLRFGFRFLQVAKNYLKIYVHSKSSSLIATDHLSTVSVLPKFADAKTQQIGLGFMYENLDYFFNPRKGLKWEGNTGIGNHTISKNENIPEHLYKGINLDGTLFTIQWNLEYNLPISSLFSFRVRNQLGIIDAPNLFENDLFRLGGLKSIRGFNEELFRANKYYLLGAELRLIPERNTAFYLFWDGAYYQNEVLKQKTEDYPWGVGFGLNFATKAGIFTLNYAVGKQDKSSLDFQNAKIHFGFISRF
jgi:outer membrane translocation and assembly module TamA